MSQKKEMPVFEVHEKDGRTYRIYADGKTEGFGEDPMIVNRLPVRFTDKRTRSAQKLPKRTAELTPPQAAK